MPNSPNLYDELAKNYFPIPEDPRLPNFEKGLFELENVMEYNIENRVRTDFEMERLKSQIKIGDLVKLIFKISDQDENGELFFKIERMWVIVQKIEWPFFEGVLDNDPYCTKNLKSGFVFWFHYNHILNVSKD